MNNTLQEYLDQNEPKSRDKIYLEGDKLKEFKLEGKELVIENYYNLETLYISELPDLTMLTIRGCEKLERLEIFLNKEIKIILDGKVPLKKIRTNGSIEKPIIIQKGKAKEGFCWSCAIHATSLIVLAVLAVFVVYLISMVKELKMTIRKLKSKS